MEGMVTEVEKAVGKGEGTGVELEAAKVEDWVVDLEVALEVEMVEVLGMEMEGWWRRWQWWR